MIVSLREELDRRLDQLGRAGQASVNVPEVLGVGDRSIAARERSHVFPVDDIRAVPDGVSLVDVIHRFGGSTKPFRRVSRRVVPEPREVGHRRVGRGRRGQGHGPRGCPRGCARGSAPRRALGEELGEGSVLPRHPRPVPGQRGGWEPPGRSPERVVVRAHLRHAHPGIPGVQGEVKRAQLVVQPLRHRHPLEPRLHGAEGFSFNAAGRVDIPRPASGAPRRLRRDVRRHQTVVRGLVHAPRAAPVPVKLAEYPRLEPRLGGFDPPAG